MTETTTQQKKVKLVLLASVCLNLLFGGYAYDPMKEHARATAIHQLERIANSLRPQNVAIDKIDKNALAMPDASSLTKLSDVQGYSREDRAAMTALYQEINK